MPKVQPFLCLINHHSDLKLVTSPVKLCLLPPSPPHHDLEHHKILKHGKQVYIPALPAPTGTNVLHFDMISLPISNITPLSGLPLRFSCRGWAHFLLGRQNMPWACSTRCLGYIVMLVPSSLNWPVQARIKSFSVRILVCKTLAVPRSDATGCLFFTRRQGKIFRDPRVTWRYRILHFSFENVPDEQKSETMLNLLRCEYL